MCPAKSGGNWPLPFAEPEEVGMSSERLSRIRPVMQKFIDEKMDPNFVTMVVRKGKIVYYEAQGYMDFESKKPAGKDTIYRMWSNTKPVTGAAAMICVEDGLLDLDDPLSKYLPAFANPSVKVLDPPKTESGRNIPTGMTPTVPARREVTVRDCLRNTTGFATAANAPIQYLTEFADLFPDKKWFSGPEIDTTIDRLIEAQARLPLESHPGTRFEYHVGFPIAGRVLEIVTGKNLSDFYEERVFKPLGMKDTSFYLPKSKLDRFPTSYRATPAGNQWKLTVSDVPAKSDKVLGPKNYFDAGGGGAGILTTVADYARFSQMLLNGGELEGVRILGRKSVEVMTSSHTSDDIYIPLQGPGFGFGIGVGVYKGGVPTVMRSPCTFGWSGAAGTICIMDPREELMWLCFTQVMMHRMMPGNTCHEDMERLVYQALI
jgi:CubicO group peptidase (beta-lactamase class C family)